MTFEQYIEGMSTRDLVAQLICPAIRATYKDNSDPREYFDVTFGGKNNEVKPGSVFIFPSKKDDIIKMTKMFNEHNGRPTLFCTDMETSPSIIEGATNFGSAMVISAADSLEDAYTCGESCAVEGNECGIHWALGPCIDLCYDKKASIGVRNFSDDPARVLEYGQRFIDGMEQNGMMATGKHFPGCGTFDGDSHLHVTFNTLSMDEWMESYGKVWKGVIDNGVHAIMPGHMCFPAAEPDGEIIPSTLSYNVITKFLREKLGFDGLVVTDGFNMGGLVPYVRYDKAFVKAIQAGCDILLFTNFCAPLSETVDILENAVNTGELTIERIKESVYRLWKEKKRLGLFDENNGNYRECPAEKREKYAETAKRIGKNAISIFKNEKNVLPLDESKIKKVISIDITNQERSVKNGVDDIFRANGIEVVKYGNEHENGIVSVMDFPKADAVIINFYYGSVWAGLSNMPHGKMLQRVYEYIFKPDVPVIMICHGNPFIPIIFPYVRTVVNTFSLTDLNAQAIYDVLFGKQEAKGVSPFTLDIRQPKILD